MRLSACLGVPLDVIEPCGFLWDERKIRQSAMDYIEHLSLSRHISWDKFRESAQGRVILLSTKAAVPYLDFQFQPGDTLLAGRESAGVPDFVHESVDARLFIPMQPGLRSLNVVNACAMVLGEALRQNGLTS